MNALVYIHIVINKMHHSDAPLRELINHHSIASYLRSLS